MINNTETPTIKEELNRKTIETLEYLIQRRQLGHISESQISTGLDVLFMNVSGLVDDDFVNLITAADAEFCQEKK